MGVERSGVEWSAVAWRGVFLAKSGTARWPLIMLIALVMAARARMQIMRFNSHQNSAKGACRCQSEHGEKLMIKLLIK